MINRIHRRKHARDEEINGFTLIEILIVIVVLGILAAVVIFALGGITGKSAVAACQADGSTVSTAISDFNNQNPGTTLTASNYLADLTTKDADNNNQGPYLQSWPSNSPHYAFSYTTSLQLAVPSSGTPGNYVGPSSCANVS